MWSAFLIILFYSVFSINICCDDYERNNSHLPQIFDDHAVLIVSTVDGYLHGINAENGNVIWQIKNPPLVSQSLSKLEFIKDSKKYRLIPSLEGQLYMLEIDGEDNGLRSLPITADALFSNTFHLSSDSLLVGGKDQRVFGFNPFTGEVKYRCGKDGCEQDNSLPRNKNSCDLLICRRISHVVRAVDLEMGYEKWNFSVGQDDVVSLDKDTFPHSPLAQGGALITGGCKVIHESKDAGIVRWSFNVELGEVHAIMKPPFNRVLWKRRLASSLSRIWLLEDNTVKQLALFAGDAQGRVQQITDESGCPHRRSLFLGVHQGHMYVQLEDGNARSAPRPRYVPLTGDDGTRKPFDVASSLSRRHRISRMTRYEVTALQQGFFRPPTAKDLSEYVDSHSSWLLFHNEGIKDDYYQSTTPTYEPLVVRYGNFLFQKFVFGCLLVVIAHLIFSNIYLPYHLRKQSLLRRWPSLRDKTTGRINIVRPATIVPPTPSLSTPSTNSSTLPTPTVTADQYESRYDSDYEHVRCLGRGAFGVVFEARHRVDQYRYAVKRVRVRYSESARSRLLQEVQAFAHLEHPGIVRYYQAWFEMPPHGWQEQRDRSIGLCSKGDDGDDYCEDDEAECSSDSSNTSMGQMNKTMSISNPAGDLSDSLIIFDRTMAGAGNSGDNIIPMPSSHCSSSAASSSESTDPTPNNAKCAHIYLYISMHLYSSRSLKTWLQEHRSPPFPSQSLRLELFAQIVDAVAYLHSNGLMHRDLKPSNILFDNYNHIRIVDFGLATSLLRSNPPPSQTSIDSSSNQSSIDQILTSANGDGPSLTSNVGTELYMSPEQQRHGARYNQKVDVFALGIIFLELMVPLSTEMERAVVLTQARRLQFDSWIMESFSNEVAFASRLLNEDPAQRPTCDQILHDPILASVIDQAIGPRQRLHSASTSSS